MEAIQDFLQLIAKMQWSDYLDIIVVAFLVYKLLPLIRTPSIMRIARTVIAIVVLAWLTDVAELHTISFILNQFLAVGLWPSLFCSSRNCAVCWIIWAMFRSAASSAPASPSRRWKL